MSKTHPDTLGEVLARREERQNRDRAKEHAERGDWYAGLYGLRLRQQGFTPAEAAARVIERYPHTRDRLLPIVLKGDRA